ncbi:MAG: hypothetical protein AAF092_03445 [Pseudomonadota bacterium]
MPHPSMTLIASVTAFAALGACAPRAPITQPPVAVTFLKESAQSAQTGVDTTTVRTRLRQDGQTTELVGVPCILDGPNYTARFQTPATLTLPLFGNTAPQVALSCRYDGESRSVALRARNLSEEERRANRDRVIAEISESGARVSALLNFDLTPRRPQGFDTFSYPDQSFTFRR